MPNSHSIRPELSNIDQHRLRAAEGWLELGCLEEAAAELATIGAARRSHPAVLKVRWDFHALAGDWAAALELATTITARTPGQAHGWLQRSYSLFRMGNLVAARDLLARAAQYFPNSESIYYNLACYECRLGEFEAAQAQLQKAFALGGKELRSAARTEPDLQPLHSYRRSPRRKSGSAGLDD